MDSKDNKTKRLNWFIIDSNIREAREQLEKIEKLIERKTYPHEGELQVFFKHAYHHLNFAWNVRRTKTKDYANLSDEDFNRWGQFPNDIEFPRLEIKKAKKEQQSKKEAELRTNKVHCRKK